MTRGYFQKGDRNEGVYAYKQLLISLKKAKIITQGVDDNNIFGDGTVLVREIPADLRPEDASATLEELAHKLLLHTADQSALRDELLHTVACKSAIKAGMHTDPAELQALVDKVQSGAVRYCPHGRPVAVEMTRYQIEKMFKRA